MAGPFELNRDRFTGAGRDSHWEGGYYFEVFVGGRERDMESEAMEHFWESDRTVVVDFEGREFEFASNACDENVTPLIEQVRMAEVECDAMDVGWRVGG